MSESPLNESPANVVVETAEAYAALAAQLVAQALCRRLEVSERVGLFLAGGSTPQRPYRRLAALPLPWRRVEFFWGDERCVPADDRRSNYELARRELLDPVGASEGAIHRIPVELGAALAARRYEDQLRRYVELPEKPPDVVLLGVGEDGHTASLFGGASEATESPRAWVVATEAPRPPKERVTLTVDLLAAARHVLFLVAGENKAAVVARLLDAPSRDVSSDPAEKVGDGAAARVARRARRVTWILDEAAACHLG